VRSKARAERGDEWLHALGQLVDDLISGAHNRPYEVIREAIFSMDVQAHADNAVFSFCSEAPILSRNQNVADPDVLAVRPLVVTDEES
jgi:hypothetical protein